jgi:hypothetical protein
MISQRLLGYSLNFYSSWIYLYFFTCISLWKFINYHIQVDMISQRLLDTLHATNRDLYPAVYSIICILLTMLVSSTTSTSCFWLGVWAAQRGRWGEASWLYNRKGDVFDHFGSAFNNMKFRLWGPFLTIPLRTDWNFTVILYFCNHTPLVILVCEDVESNPDPKSWNSPSDLSNFHLNIRSMRNQLH